MILVAGGTGRLGTQVVSLLTARGLDVRVLSRSSAPRRYPDQNPVEFVTGDVRDAQAVKRAMGGVQTVVSAIHGFTGTHGCNPRTVDLEGNDNLIRAAKDSGVNHFVLLSIQGAAANHPMELIRMKHAAEQNLMSSGLNWTIIRATAFMETWGEVIGEPLLRTGKTRIFGRGENPINFVSVHDVARFVELAVVDPALQSTVLEVGGPENLTLKQVAATFESVTGKTGVKSAIPRAMMRVMSVLMRPVNPAMARQIHAGVVMDTADMSFDGSDRIHLYPSIPCTSFRQVVRRDYLDQV